MTNLKDALDQSADALRHLLNDALDRRKELVEELAELDDQINRARVVIGDSPIAEAPAADLTLHKALELVLTEAGNRWMSAKELTDEVNRRGLYRMRDGRPLEPGQVHARVRNYDAQFERGDGRYRLVYTFETTPKGLPGGAYAAVETVVTNTAGESMVFESRASYTASGEAGVAAEALASEQGEDRARRVVFGGGFVSGARDCALLTSRGWEPVEPGV